MELGDAVKCPPNHTMYLSQTVAENAAILHTFKNPHCDTIRPFPCGDHYHIGHTSKAGKDACLKGQSE